MTRESLPRDAKGANIELGAASAIRPGHRERQPSRLAVCPNQGSALLINVTLVESGALDVFTRPRIKFAGDRPMAVIEERPAEEGRITHEWSRVDCSNAVSTSRAF